MEPNVADTEKAQTYPPPPAYSSSGYPGPPQVGQPPGNNFGPPPPQNPVIIQTAPTTGVGVSTGGVTVISGMGMGGAMMVNCPVGPYPTQLTCRSCNMEIVTKIERKPIFATHLMAVGLCLVCCIPCALIPYCTDAVKGYDHYCPNCQAYIASYPPK